MLMISTLKNVVLLLNTDRAIKLCWAHWSWVERNETLLLAAGGVSLAEHTGRAGCAGCGLFCQVPEGF